MSLNELKLVLAVCTLLAGALGGLVPLIRRRPFGARRIVGAGNAFAAGLFLAIGLLHFLPESAASFSSVRIVYPAASLLAVGAFLLLLLFEHVILPDAAHDAAHAHSGDGRHSHSAHGSTGRDSEARGPVSERGDAHGEARASAYVLVLALSLHSVLAGGALGSDADTQGALLTFMAIAVHKGAAGLALGLALAGSGIARGRALGLVGLFAAMTPLGILLGAVVGGGLRGGDQVLFDASAAGLAAGTFLYIGAFDLVQDEFLRAGRRWLKWICALGGASVAALLAAWL